MTTLPGGFIVPMLNELDEPISYNGVSGKYGVRDECNTLILSVHDDLLAAARACKETNPGIGRYVLFVTGWRFGLFGNHNEEVGSGRYVDAETGECIDQAELLRRLRAEQAP